MHYRTIQHTYVTFAHLSRLLKETSFDNKVMLRWVVLSGLVLPWWKPGVSVCETTLTHGGRIRIDSRLCIYTWSSVLMLSLQNHCRCMWPDGRCRCHGASACICMPHMPGNCTILLLSLMQSHNVTIIKCHQVLVMQSNASLVNIQDIFCVWWLDMSASCKSNQFHMHYWSACTKLCLNWTTSSGSLLLFVSIW